MKNSIFRLTNEFNLKKVDVFINNLDFTNIQMNNNRKSFSIKPLKLNNYQLGDNLDLSISLFHV